MGRFDMTSRYDGTLRLTKSELYNELLDEAGPDAADSGMDYDLVKSKFLQFRWEWLGTETGTDRL